MIERIKATLERFGVTFDTWFSERTPARRRDRARVRAACRDAGTPTGRRARCGCGPASFGDDQDRVIVSVGRRPDLLRRRRRLPREQARARLRAPDHAARRRPPRLRAALQGGAGRARRRPRPARDPAAPVRAHRRARRARLDVQAARRVHHARRPGRPDRRRRHALLHAPALARLDDRPRPRPGARGVGREPRLLRPVRARPDRLDPAQGGQAGPPRSSGELSLHPSERELVKKLLAFPAEAAEAAERRAPHRIAVYALELAQTFTAFYRDCQVVGAEPRGRRVVPARALAWRPSARSPARSGCSASRRPSRCSAQSSLKKFSPRLSSACWASMLSVVSSPVKSRMPMAIRTAPEREVMIR